MTRPLRAFFVFIFLLVILMPPSKLFADDRGDLRNIVLRLDRVNKELDVLRSEQEKIAKRQDEIIETIKNLKIVARK
ncbi:MAG: hypothetical protein HYS55_04265 [Candidatus Omnitrophica bacterium]|nr:hypothetical protein [Candidatus Omnitrophota bacterium]